MCYNEKNDFNTFSEENLKKYAIAGLKGAITGAAFVVGAGSAVLGTTVFGTTIGIVGAVAIYYLEELIDNEWEWIKKQIFE